MKVDWQKTASILFCAAMAVAFFFLVGKYLVVILAPFLIAWVIALLASPAASAIAARTRLPRKLAVVLLLLLFFALLVLLFTLGIHRLTAELGRLAERFASGDQLSRLMDDIESMGDRLPFLDGDGKLRESLDNMVNSLLREAASVVASAVTAFATGLLKATPSIMLFVVVTVISSFYFALDLEAVHRSLVALLPTRFAERIPMVKQRVRRFVIRYLRVYLFLMFITFCELFAGFSILRVEYSFLLALAISVIDIFPVLGVGTALIPWSLIELFDRDFRMGFGLLILWAVVTVVRQIAEPHFVGESIGLHPLLTLVGMYIGFRLFGIPGMLLSPALIIAVRTGLREWMPRKIDGKT